MTTIAVLGSTGSIGHQTLDVVRQQPSLEVVGLAAGSNFGELAKQAEELGVRWTALSSDSNSASAAKVRFSGSNALVELIDACEPDIVLNAVSGAAGLRASAHTVERGIDLAIANKESLVAAGPLLLRRASETGAAVLPVDSEHSAIQQCLVAGEANEVRKIHLTASGGPFRGWPREDLESVTADEALRHPTWSMGRKISIDSATLMNKALEVIEAHVLFGLTADQIDVVVHPESVVHSLVEFVDGAFIAHLGATDMRIPIQYALSHPRRWASPAPQFTLADLHALHFEEVDHAVFPAIGLARDAIERSGTTPAVLNAANEVAVHAFLEGRIRFTRIDTLVQRAMEEHSSETLESIDQVLEIDRTTREIVDRWIS